MGKKKILVIVSLIILLISSVTFYYLYNVIYSDNVKNDSYIYIKTSHDKDSVYHYLSPYMYDIESFKIVSELKKYPKLIKPGRYFIKKGMNNNTLINLLRSGDQEIVKVSFNNINTIEKLAGKISMIIEPDSLSLLTAFRDVEFIKNTKFDTETAILMYIPNTYHLKWNTSATQFRSRMLNEYNNYWNEQRINYAKKHNLTAIEVGILASIVQKESSFVSERKTIAGLYLNRLSRNWKLQADPTVIYAVKKIRGDDFEIKRVLNKDLQVNSAYNTYKVKGLPPGPISMPDISSIESVLHSEKHKYMYMCASIDKIGTHAFAKTLIKHMKNARTYQKWLSKQGVNR